MRVPQENVFSLVPPNSGPLYRLTVDLTIFFRELARVINGRVGFGDGVSSDNLAGEWITFIGDETPGTEVAVSHNLGVVPCGFLLMMPPQSGTVNRGTTTWTTSTVYLSTSAASEEVTIFLLPGTSA